MTRQVILGCRGPKFGDYCSRPLVNATHFVDPVEQTSNIIFKNYKQPSSNILTDTGLYFNRDWKGLTTSFFVLLDGQVISLHISNFWVFYPI